jgi:hypothetical protein
MMLGLGGDEIFSVVYCSALFVRRKRIHHLSYLLGVAANHRRRIDDAVFSLLSMEGETTLVKQLIMGVMFTSYLQDLLFLHLLFTLMLLEKTMERDTTILEAGTGDSPNP